jgi:trehalose 6-phosphate phosphatase
MEYFFAEPDRIKHLAHNRHLCLFLDYDGTLSPIAPRPEKAVISTETKELLKALTKCDRIELAIVTGRALPDIKKLIGLKSVTYVGNHGMEIEGQNLNFICPLPKQYKNDLKQISTILREGFALTDGVIIEDKKYSLSLHYRLVDPKITPSVEEKFKNLLATYIEKNRIALRFGKMVIEVRSPADWDKGKAVLWLLEKRHTAKNLETLAIYIGDDQTDEDAFVALKDSGLTIVIGENKSSQAQYYLNNTSEVVEFLRQVLELELNLGHQ